MCPTFQWMWQEEIPELLAVSNSNSDITWQHLAHPTQLSCYTQYFNVIMAETWIIFLGLVLIILCDIYYPFVLCSNIFITTNTLLQFSRSWLLAKFLITMKRWRRNWPEPSTASGSCSRLSWSLGSACIAGSANPWSWTWSSTGTVALRSSLQTSETLTFVWSCFGGRLARSWQSFLSLFLNHLEWLQQQSNPQPPGLQEFAPWLQSPPPDSLPRWSLWKLRTFCWWTAQRWREWCGVLRLEILTERVVTFDNCCQLGQHPATDVMMERHAIGRQSQVRTTNLLIGQRRKTRSIITTVGNWGVATKNII